VPPASASSPPKRSPSGSRSPLPSDADYRALTGDPADDIPGIRGIGPKTAAALLAGSTSLEELRDSAALTRCRRQEVTANWDKLLAWRDIIRLNDKIPLGAAAVTGQPTAPMPRAAEILDALGLW
jgi:5'-3' exonuclease